MTDREKPGPGGHDTPGTVPDEALDQVTGGGTVAAHEIAHIDRGMRTEPTTREGGQNVTRHLDTSTGDHD